MDMYLYSMLKNHLSLEKALHPRGVLILCITIRTLPISRRASVTRVAVTGATSSSVLTSVTALSARTAASSKSQITCTPR